MKQFFVIALLLCSRLSVAAQDSAAVKLAIHQLDAAMVSQDTVALQRYLHKEVSYGHSNGWIQSLADVKNDFASSKVKYTKMVSSGEQIRYLQNGLATVTVKMEVQGVVDGKDFSLQLHVMQVWKRAKKQWQLLARQSAKIN